MCVPYVPRMGTVVSQAAAEYRARKRTQPDLWWVLQQEAARARKAETQATLSLNRWGAIILASLVMAVIGWAVL